MPIIAMFGPHAVGKTTAARRYSEKYGELLRVVLADIQLEVHGGRETRVKGWKGSLDDKHALIRQAEETPIVTLIESCSSYGTQILRGLRRSTPIVHVYTSPIKLLENLEARAVRLGKKFNKKYWDSQKLCYEASRRLTNCIQQCAMTRVNNFLIDSYETDWPIVDDYFSTLFREAHNSLLRRR